jgi:hypothetical protein
VSPSESTSQNSFSSIEGMAAAILFAPVPRQEHRSYNLVMKHSEFVVGKSFWCGGREWRCTDIGMRTIVAICLDETEIVRSWLDPALPETRRTLSRSDAEAEGWFNGPPYAVAESIFDEYDIHPCSFDPESNGETPLFFDSEPGTWVRGPLLGWNVVRKLDCE